MKAWLRKVGLGLKFAEQLAVMAGDHGLTIQGRNPAEVDAVIRASVKAGVAVLKKAPQPGVLVPTAPPSSPGD
jgi:hypothetical protein